MSLSTFKPFSYRTPPVVGADASLSKLPVLNAQLHPPLQVKRKIKSAVQESSCGSSRRELLHLTAGSVGLLSLLLPAASASAEAATGAGGDTIIQKLLQIFGFSKPKDEGQEEAETKGANPKPKDEIPKVEKGEEDETTQPDEKEKKKTDTAQDLKVAPSEEEDVIPAP